MSDPKDCRHDGIGLPGCKTCDPKLSKPPVPEAPALPEGEMPDVCVRVEPLVYVPLERLRRVLASQGLRVVDAKDWRVLERIAKYAREDRAVTPGCTRLERALDELARRGKP